MNNFIFYSPTEFVFGRDTEAQTGALVKKQGAKKVMIVYGGGSVIRSGLLSRVESSLKEVGIEYCMLGGVQPNPVDIKVYEGIELCRSERADLLLAVGGGSVIDTAKAIAAPKISAPAKPLCLKNQPRHATGTGADLKRGG